MTTFNLGAFSVDLPVEPLTGECADADRQTAWRVYLELVVRPSLRCETGSVVAIEELVEALRGLLATWPAAQLNAAGPRQLGAVVLSIIDMILLPFVRARQPSASTWHALREFCRDFAIDLAQQYRFAPIGMPLPADVDAAWRQGE